MRVKCSDCISPASIWESIYSARLTAEITKPTINPISVHFSSALARTGIVFLKLKYMIRPISGNKNAKTFSPVDGLSSC